jgi:predicted lipid-binding transport protein (Tim44 family)
MTRRSLSSRTALGRALPVVRRALPWVALTAALVLGASVALARPGGGNSFGGGSRSSGGGGGGGGGGDCGAIAQLVLFLVELTIDHPAIGVPLDVIIIGVVVWAFRSKMKTDRQRDWDMGTTAAAFAAQNAARPSRAIRRQLFQGVAQYDPEFSLIPFEDFVYALYAAVHEARGAHRTATLVPYLRGDVLASLRDGAPGVERVHSIVIGALRYVDPSSTTGPRAVVTLEFEANYTEVSQGREQAYYVVERWTLSRARTARSRKPAAARTIGCPNCGAPLDGLRGNVCSYCNTAVDTGQLDWMVDQIALLERTPRPPQLTNDTPERGNALRTVVDADAQLRFSQLTRKDPAFSWQRFTARVALIFGEMQVAWSTREWSRARPFVSDQLFQMLSYWIETYRREKLRNVTENARITHMEIAAVLSDRHYDAITVRVFATGLDYTVTDDGRVVSGSRSRERPYTEYWTLIRGASTPTKAHDDRVCPNCGAPLQINMSGNCTVCKVKVTAGDFDWVLSRIEQDEAYS